MFPLNTPGIFGTWQSFYQLTGGAAATLTGLLFIVVSLSAGRPGSDRGVRLFTSPTVFHLVSVLMISALALAPDGDGGPPSVLMTGWSALAAIYATVLAIEIGGIRKPTHWSDFWWYGAAPVVNYLGLAAANAAAWARLSHAAYWVALCLMALLVVAIRNAWDLITWLAPRQGSQNVEAEGPAARSNDGDAAVDKQTADHMASATATRSTPPTPLHSAQTERWRT